MKITLLTPTARPHLLSTSLLYLERAMAECPGVEIEWWLLTYDDEPVPSILSKGRSWIRHLSIPRADFQPVMQLLNVALDTVFSGGKTPAEVGWIWVPQDDNIAFPRNLFSALVDTVEANPDAQILVVNQHRGQNGVSHPCTPLLAQPDYMNVGMVNLEQYLIRGDVHAGERYIDHGCGDGELMVRLFARMPERFHFMPHIWIPYNALEPGRWLAASLHDLLEDCYRVV